MKITLDQATFVGNIIRLCDLEDLKCIREMVGIRQEEFDADSFEAASDIMHKVNNTKLEAIQ